MDPEDQVNEEVSQDTPTPEVQPEVNQSKETVEAGGQSQVITVGNQTFKTINDLIKAHTELQRGFTQKTQEYSQKMKAFESYHQWLSAMTPEERERFVKYVKGEHLKEANTVQQPPKQQVQSQQDPRFDQLSDAQEEAKARIELMEFKGSHPDMDQEALKDVVKFVIARDEAGETYWTLEMAYRWLMHDKNAAKMVSTGQKQAEEAIAKGKKATVLGSTPVSAQANAQTKGPKTPWHKLSEADQRKAIEAKLKEMNIDFEEE